VAGRATPIETFNIQTSGHWEHANFLTHSIRFQSVFPPFSRPPFTVFHPFFTVLTVSGDFFRKVTLQTKCRDGNDFRQIVARTIMDKKTTSTSPLRPCITNPQKLVFPTTI